MKSKKTYVLRSIAQCDPDGENACVSMNGNCKVGMIIDQARWFWRDINRAHSQATAYNSKTCGCRVEVIEEDPPF